MSNSDLSIWDEDSMPEYDAWYDIVIALDMTIPELEGWLEGCKKEAWVFEKLAEYENREKNLAMARYFWRRTDTLKSYIRQLNKYLDDEIDAEEC